MHSRHFRALESLERSPQASERSSSKASLGAQHAHAAGERVCVDGTINSGQRTTTWHTAMLGSEHACAGRGDDTASKFTTTTPSPRPLLHHIGRGAACEARGCGALARRTERREAV